MRKFFLLVVTFFACVLLSECSHSVRHPELRRLDKETNDAMARFADASTDSLAQLLLQKAQEANDLLYEGKAHFYLSSYRRGLDSATVRSKLAHLDKAETIAKETGNDTLLSFVYNQRGVWEIGQNLAPVTARYWFNKSIETATPLNERWVSIPAEINMLEACRLTGDSLGIKYGRDLFEYACASTQPELMFTTGLNCALFYARTSEDSTVLRPYISAINALPEMAEGVPEMIYATYFFQRRDYERAARYMEKSNPARYNDFAVFYAEILNKAGRYSESEEWLDRLGAASAGVLYPDTKETVLRLHASNAAARGDWHTAYTAQTKYEALMDSVEEQNVLDLSKRYNTEYEVNLKDRQIADQTRDLRELKLWIVWVVAFVTLIIAGLCIFIWRRRKFYRDIVRQNLDFVERQKEYEQRLAEHDAKGKVPQDETVAEIAPETRGERTVESSAPKINESRIDEIFGKIRTLAEEKQVWRDVNITRDSFADMVGCNRTYFTEAIKERTGLSYTQYMNSCRIREAIKVLSDTADDTPLKELSVQLGFLTLANFYASFKKETGMSPAAFRKTARELKTPQKGS